VGPEYHKFRSCQFESLPYLDLVHRLIFLYTLKHGVSEAGCASFFR
jgi:hypothetical protein